MPTLITEPPAIPQPPSPPRKRWTRVELEALEASGMLDGEHLELIEGELINKMGKNRPHSDSARFLDAWLVRVFGLRYVNFESTIEVAPKDNGVNRPEPDFFVLNRSFKRFRTAIPRPEDIVLIVEISDTSLDFDLGVKAALYARAGIADYWVLDVQGRRLIVHRDPLDGRYQSVVEYGEDESVAPLAAPEVPFPVREAFPDEEE
jgi:Uma2 family endonuclease